MADQPLISIDRHSGHIIVELLVDDLLHQLQVARMKESLISIVQEHKGRAFILDFTQVKSICSSAIGLLLSVKKKVEDGNGRFCLCGINSNIPNTSTDTYIYEIFKVVKLDNYFEIYPTRLEAVEACSS